MKLLLSANEQEKAISNVNNLYRVIDIKPQRTIEDFFNSRHKSLYSTIATRGLEKAVLRVGLNIDSNKAIEREIVIYETARSRNLNGFPEVLEKGAFREMHWFTYKYIEGTTAGTTYQYSDSTNFDLILDFLADIQKIFQYLPKNIILKDNHRSDYRQYLVYTLNKILSTRTGNFNQKLIHSLRLKIREGLEKIKTVGLVHGDFHAQNIFLHKNSIKVIDWEMTHLNSVAFDYAFTWVRCQNKAVRNKIQRQLDSLYPGAKKEINTIFALNTMRDYFAWLQALQSENELLSENNLINGVSIKAVINDLEEELGNFDALL